MIGCRAGRNNPLRGFTGGIKIAALADHERPVASHHFTAYIILTRLIAEYVVQENTNLREFINREKKIMSKDGPPGTAGSRVRNRPPRSASPAFRGLGRVRLVVAKFRHSAKQALLSPLAINGV